MASEFDKTLPHPGGPPGTASPDATTAPLAPLPPPARPAPSPAPAPASALVGPASALGPVPTPSLPANDAPPSTPFSARPRSGQAATIIVAAEGTTGLEDTFRSKGLLSTTPALAPTHAPSQAPTPVPAPAPAPALAPTPNPGSAPMPSVPPANLATPGGLDATFISGSSGTLAAGTSATVAAPSRNNPTAPMPSPLTAPIGAVMAVGAMTTQGRTCVLPTLTSRGLVAPSQPQPRYQVVEKLGEGGMGEVVLAQDQDIGRKVAVKHLHANLNDELGVARFIEEVRTVGGMEHPGIVPIHDVGLDEQGRYFFVMKHIEGETLERIIERLRAGDPRAQARYPFEARLRIFLSLLKALEYAHSRGFIHRDIKPANVMVGKFGEVVLMDWGIAKAKTSTLPVGVTPTAQQVEELAGKALYSTRHGALIGTPAYMSPEQAKGDIGAIDERSDLYSACVMFHEFVTLNHYLSGQTTMGGMLKVITQGTAEERRKLWDVYANKHPAQSLPPAEYIHMIEHGTEIDPAKRYQSAGALIDLVEQTLAGEIKVECMVTMTKRRTRDLGKMIDKHPGMMSWGLIGAVVMVAASAVVLVVEAVRLLH